MSWRVDVQQLVDVGRSVMMSKLNWLGLLVKYQDGMPVSLCAPIQHDFIDVFDAVTTYT